MLQARVRMINMTKGGCDEHDQKDGDEDENDNDDENYGDKRICVGKP